MKNPSKTIAAGVGLGTLKFGLTRDELRAQIGEPDEIDAFSYSEDEEDLTEAWHYDELELSVTFDEALDWRMSSMAVSGADYELSGQKLIGLEQMKLTVELEKIGIGPLNFEDFSTEETPDHKLIAHEDSGLNFWMEGGSLSEIQWGPNLIDDDTIEWPD